MEDKHLFKPIRLSLRHEDDQAGRKIRENQIVQIYQHISIKIDSAVNRYRDWLLKREIESRRKRDKAITPFMLTEYSWTDWRTRGNKNFKLILAKLENYMSDKSSIGVNRTLNYSLKQYYWDLLSPEKRKELCTNKLDKLCLFFDSSFFFNGGHMAILEETLDVLSQIGMKFKVLVLLDRNMILFPTLCRAILNKYDDVHIIDVSRRPIRLPSGQDELKDIASELGVDDECLQIDLPKSNSQWFGARNTSFINPFFYWNKGKSQLEASRLQTAWSKYFSKDESRVKASEIINGSLGRKFNLDRYVIIHPRNGTFLAPNIRDTLPMKDRGSLLKAIRKEGFSVVVLGMSQLKENFQSKDVLYLNNIGPIPDELQIHLINGASAFIGSPSGITTMSYCTNTPLLLLDSPIPYFTHLPPNFKILLKRLVKSSLQVKYSNYFAINQESYLEEIRDHKPWSPVMKHDITLHPHSDEAVFDALLELLSESEPKHYKYNPLKEDRMFGWRLEDCTEIDKLSKNLQPKSLYTIFSSKNLSRANWLQNTI